MFAHWMLAHCFRRELRYIGYGGRGKTANHAEARLHGFLWYLMRCTITGEPQTIYGYNGLQVRNNIHSGDLVSSFEAFHRAPRPAAVYNIGGGRHSTARCSRRSSCASRPPGPSSTGATATRRAWATTAG